MSDQLAGRGRSGGGIEAAGGVSGAESGGMSGGGIEVADGVSRPVPGDISGGYIEGVYQGGISGGAAALEEATTGAMELMDGGALMDMSDISLGFEPDPSLVKSHQMVGRCSLTLLKPY